MKNLYLLIGHVRYESNDVYGVFTDLELAVKNAKVISVEDDYIDAVLIKEMKANELVDLETASFHKDNIVYDSRNN